MKRFKKTICVVLVALMAFSGVSCGKKETGTPGVRETEIDLVKDGVSDYTVVLPVQTDETLLIAADELTYFFEESTGVRLSVVSDKGLTYAADKKYLSIGQTAIAAGASVTADAAELGDDGFVLATKGQTAFMLGGGSAGSLYAVYEFLAQNLGVKVYAEDEIALPRVNSAKLLDFSYKSVPTFKVRSMGMYDLNYSGQLRRRMRSQFRQDGWIYTSHSHFYILPPATYLATHPDWYSPDRTQICMTNEEMTKEFTRNVIELFKANPDARYCMLGIQDANTFCSCDRCLDEIAKYKESGISVRFTNKVAEGLQAWIDENQPGREFTLFCYAYLRTTAAPVTKDFQPLDPSVVPNHNVGVMLAPYVYPYNYDLMDPVNNSAAAAIIKGWDAIMSENIYMYLYGAGYGCFMLMFNDYSTLKNNFLMCRDIGSIGIFHLNAFNMESSCFAEMRTYIISRLMWDVDQNPGDLIDEFMTQYYKQAAPYVKEYFELLRIHYAMLEKELNFKFLPNTNRSAEVLDAKYWDKNFLDRCLDLMLSAQAEVEKSKESDPELYEKLSFRILKEAISVRFIRLALYNARFTSNELLAEADAFERDCRTLNIFEVRQILETGPTISEYLETWRQAARSRV